MLRPQSLVPDDLDAPFWEGCNRRTFLVHRCIACGRAYWPASTCIDHGSSSMQWQPASGRGEVFTYTVVHHPYDRSLVDAVPYAAAVVKLDEGPFFHTDIVGCAPSDVHIGMRVHVVFDAIDGAIDEAIDGAETVIPHFAPDTDT
jgi:uncharacterized OB-fold protein